MPEKILIALINSLILLFTIIRIYVLTKKNSFIESREVLRLPLSFAMAGYASLLLTPVFIILPIYFKDISQFHQVISNTIFLILCYIGYYFIVFHHNHRLYYTEYYFEVQSFRGHVGTQTWDDVASVRNNKLNGRLFITIQDESVIRISPFLKGYKKFRIFLLKKHLKTI